MPTPAEPPFHVAIVGAGAVGAVFGAALARRGARVTFVARGDTLAALREHGLAVDGPDGESRLPPGGATDDPAAIGPVPVVLVAVKAEQVPLVAPTLAPLVGPDTVVVPLQNGVEASGQLAAALDPAHVAEGFCRMLAERVAPGRVRYGGTVPTIAFGRRAGGDLAPAARATLDALGALLRDAGVGVETPADVHAALWEKFLFVEPLGVVGAATRGTFGELLGVPETRAALEACVREILAVGRAHGAALAEDAVTRVWERYVALPAGGTASMQRDLVAGRPSELEAQTGAVVRLGAARGVPTPVHATLYAALKPQELRARAGGDSSHRRAP